jgi:thiopurine S-methyltransferase
MNPDFWHERWTKGQIGFHQADFNSHMQAFVDRLQVKPGGNIFVPLCGKSLDMLWLLEEGFRVTGVEISSLAVESFFAENELPMRVSDLEDCQLYSGNNLDIYCGEFFKVELTHSPHIDAVYDRASLIALPEEMRAVYVDRLTSLIPAKTRSMLVTLDYPQQQMSGPPFSVTSAEVEELFASRYTIEHLHSEDCLANEPRFRAKGLSRLDEHVFLLQKNAD